MSLSDFLVDWLLLVVTAVVRIEHQKERGKATPKWLVKNLQTT
jgi:hypothetical protein